ncbi:Pyridine nucleotide-disulfide oxidoreductase domain-containing protein 2 [Vitis vinifera]|uniref:Pyridine nucleotide-disulfide oxidoreductase domain-containing protein 2 n=1 Tax=Vitis vinifera TaxID=29760 RepID=A0A438EVT2_VITVI|nr:Pyridine nucleotide-disulfide oxidoreductase domain-containing protein 2 [Vitis vinifera]
MWRRCFSSNINSTRTLKEKKWDALVIGAGHNGSQPLLTWLALASPSPFSSVATSSAVLPSLKNSFLALSSPAAATSRASSALHRQVPPTLLSEDLELAKHGLKLLKMKAATFTPCVDGRYLLLTYNQKQNYKEISRFSKRDADAFPRERGSVVTLDGLRGLGDKPLMDFVDLLLSPTSKVEMLDDWNSIGNEVSLAASCLAWNWDSGISISIPGSNSTTDVLKATLVGDAIIGSKLHAPGSGYVLLHHVMGNTDGERNVWSHVEGGMGSVSSAISKAAREAGAHIVTNAEVSQLMIEDSGVVNGVSSGLWLLSLS